MTNLNLENQAAAEEFIIANFSGGTNYSKYAGAIGGALGGTINYLSGGTLAGSVIGGVGGVAVGYAVGSILGGIPSAPAQVITGSLSLVAGARAAGSLCQLSEGLIGGFSSQEEASEVEGL